MSKEPQLDIPRDKTIDAMMDLLIDIGSHQRALLCILEKHGLEKVDVKNLCFHDDITVRAIEMQRVDIIQMLNEKYRQD
ncbi:MAG: hypothetical protein JNM41_09530 [Flavipsychrobacter sp.]|nr:hypothetical protein [Flavipsychrobacter sp.]